VEALGAVGTPLFNGCGGQHRWRSGGGHWVRGGGEGCGWIARCRSPLTSLFQI
jgi:hypothetical protein